MAEYSLADLAMRGIQPTQGITLAGLAQILMRGRPVRPQSDSALGPSDFDPQDLAQILRWQDVGGGTGGVPLNDPLAKLKMQQEMNDYIPKRVSTDI